MTSCNGCIVANALSPDALCVPCVEAAARLAIVRERDELRAEVDRLRDVGALLGDGGEAVRSPYLGSMIGCDCGMRRGDGDHYVHCALVRDTDSEAVGAHEARPVGSINAPTSDVEVARLRGEVYRLSSELEAGSMTNEKKVCSCEDTNGNGAVRAGTCPVHDCSAPTPGDERADDPAANADCPACRSYEACRFHATGVLFARVRVLETQVASLQMAAPRGTPQAEEVPGAALMLAECRRATIEACAAWIEERAHTGWRSVDVPAALRAQMSEMATLSVGEATESQEKP